MEESMAKLTFECNAEDILPDLFNHLDENEIIDTALSVPLLKRRYKEFLRDNDIAEGFSEDILEASFVDWLLSVLDGTDVKVTFDIDYLKE